MAGRGLANLFRPPWMAGVQKTQEQFSAGPSLDIAAPAHPCARGMRPPWMAEVQKMQEQFSAGLPLDKNGVTSVTPWLYWVFLKTRYSNRIQYLTP